MVIFHLLYQSLDLACKFPEERKSVWLRTSARIFHPKGPELEVSMALISSRSPHHELAETLLLRDEALLAQFRRVIATNNLLKTQLCVCPKAIVKGTVN